MAKYSGNYNANNGTSWMHPLTGNNKLELLKSVRETAKSERFYDNEGSFYVKDENDKMVYDGRISETGRVYYYTNNYKLTY